MFFLAKFDQDTQAGFGMQEGDIRSMRAGTGFLVDQTDAVRFNGAEGRGEVIHGKGKMLDAFTLIFDKFGDRAVFGGRAEQFYPGVSAGEESYFNFLAGHFFNGFQL